MLKDIYKENMVIEGKAKPYTKIKKTRKSPLLGLFLLLSLTGLFFFANYAFFERPNNMVRGFSIHPLGKRVRKSSINVSEGLAVPPSQYDNFINDSTLPMKAIFGLQIKRIVIDAGHGGKIPGALGTLKTLEKDITLDIARRLRSRLNKNRQYEILMTRDTDITLSLEDRIEFSNKNGADLFISIHVNSIPVKPLNIIETYYFGPHSDKEALMLAEKENRGAGYSLNDFKDIIQNIENTMKTQESHKLASFIQGSLFKNIKRQNKNTKDFGIKTAPFVVLLGVEAPSVLAEVSCLSNLVEEKKLTTPGYRDEIAGFLEEGIVKYLSQNK